MRFAPSKRGFCKVTTIFVGSPFGTKTVSAALGGSFLKLSPPSDQDRINSRQGIWPTTRAGRSEKKTVEGVISVSLPSLNDTPGAVCTNITGGLSSDFSVAAKAIQPKHRAIEAPAAQIYRKMFIE